MSTIRRLLAELARITEPGPSRLERVERRLRAGEPDPEHTRKLLLQLPAPDELAQRRVELRARRTLTQPTRNRRYTFGIPILVGAVAALVLALRVPAPPAALNLSIDAGELASFPVSEHVALEARGRGHVGGDDRAPRVSWDEGSLSVEVEPNQGVDLRITTDEAVIQVIGTGFSVQRDALGTSVAVRHGVVSVDCLAGGGGRLTTDENIECIPTRPSGLLGRARALAARGDAPDTVLATLEDADQAGNPPALEGEILALRVDVLQRAGRDEQTLDAATAYLDAGHQARRPEMLRIASGLLFQKSGCEAALPLLRRSVEEGGDEQDARALAACEARSGGR